MNSVHQGNSATASHAVHPGSAYSGARNNSSGSRNSRPFKTRRSLRRWIYHGIVNDVNRTPKYEDRNHKILDAILADEPVELGHTGYETSIRLQPLPNSTGITPPEFAEVCLYGDYRGEIRRGDELIIHAKKYLILKKTVGKKVYDMTNSDPDVRLRPLGPELQIPAWLIKLPFTALLILLLIALIVSTYKAGLLQIILALLLLAGFIMGCIWLIVWLVRKH